MHFKSLFSVFLLSLLVLASCNTNRGSGNSDDRSEGGLGDGGIKAPEFGDDVNPDAFLMSSTFLGYEGKAIVIFAFVGKGIWGYEVTYTNGEPTGAVARKQLTYLDGHTGAELTSAKSTNYTTMTVTFGSDIYNVEPTGALVSTNPLTPASPESTPLQEKQTFTMNGHKYFINKKGLWFENFSKEWKYIRLENPEL